LPLEARIINVADTFQALAQERPYRKPMAPDAIMAILHQRVDLMTRLKDRLV
jgi:HD-GYP domain-containing protein (c-di-GMP phosphodiesterase class II)